MRSRRFDERGLMEHWKGLGCLRLQALVSVIFEIPEERHDLPNKPMQKLIRGVDIITVIVQLFGDIK